MDNVHNERNKQHPQRTEQRPPRTENANLKRNSIHFIKTYLYSII